MSSSSGQYRKIWKQTIIIKVHQLNIDGYKAPYIQIISGKDNLPYTETLNTFNVYDDCVIVDGSKDYFRCPMKYFKKSLNGCLNNELKL